MSLEFEKMSELEPNQQILKSKVKDKDDNFKLKAGIFLGGVCGMSALFGFSTTLAASKKKDPEFFDKGLTRHTMGNKGVHEAGATLAMRALGWGTFYAVTGCGVLFYSVWKMLGVNNLHEFRMKMGNILPRIPKNDPPQGRTEFENLTDLLRYVSEEGSKKKE
ncbi:transmembrane protein 242 [Neocloeon triangulifer]|uniref:transmembrane protein 242 n=1 Tax=Neocloeon triangulifer TaxID=2078957 RepID=UPI00286EDAF3|nr:transmembrane protein 242 [Neocloeon triangulifer]